MYYTEIDPRDGKSVYVCKNPHEKAMQRALIQYRNPKNYDLVCEALTKAGRTDLIGFDKKCLIRPRRQSAGNAKGAGKDIDISYGRKNLKSRLPGQKRDKSLQKETIRNVHRKSRGIPWSTVCSEYATS